MGCTSEMNEKTHQNLGDNLLPSSDTFDKLLDEVKRIHQLEIVSLVAKIADLKQEIKRLEKNEKN